MNATKKELEILQILWDAEQPLNAKQISEYKSGMVMSTVQATLRKLLKRELIEVADIVYSGTVLSRTYAPAISQEEFIVSQYKNLSVANFVNFLLKDKKTKESEQELKEVLKLLEDNMTEE